MPGNTVLQTTIFSGPISLLRVKAKREKEHIEQSCPPEASFRLAEKVD
jgi:hypothetical protein